MKKKTLEPAPLMIRLGDGKIVTIEKHPYGDLYSVRFRLEWVRGTKQRCEVSFILPKDYLRKVLSI